MSDLALAFDPKTGAADIAVADGELVLDHGLASLALASLLTDARATREQAPGEADLRGWFGDALSSVPWGGLLWTLDRSKTLPEILRLAADYARAALEWMIEDGIAARIDVRAERIDGAGDGATLVLAIDIHRPTGERVSLLYDRLWRAT